MTGFQEHSAQRIPLYLKQVRIRNYAPLIDAQADFQPGVNIIIGPNGAGKTRFLDITSQLVTPFVVPDAGADCELILGYNQDISVYFQQINVNDKASMPMYSNAVLSLSETDLDLRVVISYKGQEIIGDDLGEALWEVGIRDDLLPESIIAKHGTPLQQLLLVDLPATLTFRLTTGKIHSEPSSNNFTYSSRPLLVSSILGTIGHLFARYNRYQRVNKISLSFTVDEVRTEVERVIAAYLDFINPFIAQYSPVAQMRLSSTYQVYDNVAQQEILVKGLVLEFFLNENWLPFESLSDGTKRILFIISQLVMPHARFSGQMMLPLPFTLETSPRLLFIEEPELGIHYAQLNNLLQLIRDVSQESQIILTTHSPQVLDMLAAVELDRITICSLDLEKGTQFHKLSEAKQEQARIYMQETGLLSDYWRYSYLESSEG